MRKLHIKYILTVIAAVAVIALSVFAPSMLSDFSDAGILDTVHVTDNEPMAEGYRYQLTPNEKLFILSKALAEREEILSDYAASARGEISYPGGSVPKAYAYSLSSPDENKTPREEALQNFYGELALVNSLGIIPAWSFEFNEDDYDMELYSAADMLKPGWAADVWQITYTGALVNAGDILLEACFDAQTGKIYSIALRSGSAPDIHYNEETLTEIITAWCEYLQLGSFLPVADGGTQTEAGLFQKKFSVAGAGGEYTTVTAGFYDGINEFFLMV